MEVLHAIDGFKGKNSLLVLGMLDGVHLGHQALIARAKALQASMGGRVTVFTFANHPKGQKLITTAEEKLAVLEALGVEVCVIPIFTEAVRQTTPEDFVTLIEQRISPVQTIVGFDYRFGKDGIGDGRLLQQLMHGHRVQIIPKVEIGGQKVSSSRLRKYVLEVDFDRFRTCCGRRYSISGVTGHGRKRGSQHGTPTINLPIREDKLIPPYGVYAVQAKVGALWFNGVANLGNAPTFDSNEPVLEVHLLDFDQEVYGEEIEVAFFRYLRGIEKFSSSNALYTQVAKDITQAKNFLPALEKQR